MNDIGDRLRQARENAGYESARAASEAMSITYSTYAGHENGHRGIMLDQALRYAKKYKVSLEWLATGRVVAGNRKIELEPEMLRPTAEIVSKILDSASITVSHLEFFDAVVGVHSDADTNVTAQALKEILESKNTNRT